MKKQIIYTILGVLGIEFLIGAIIGSFIYANYNKFLTAKSGTTDIIHFESKKIQLKKISNISKHKNQKNILYAGKFGLIKKYYKKSIKSNTMIETKKYYFKINDKNIKKYIVFSYLKGNEILDKYIFDYLNKLDDKNFDKELLKYLEFEKNLDKNTNIDSILNSINEDYNQHIKTLNNLIKNEQYEKLATKLKEFETKYDINLQTLDDNINKNYSIFQNKKLMYVISKIYSSHKEEIENVSKIFNIDKKLIISCIAVEQVRYLTTQRGYLKTLIKSNKLITFSKFSYGLGGIKVFTARRIQKDIKNYNKNIYNKYFTQDDGLVDSAMIKRLESSTGSILYVGGLIYNIEQKRKLAGYDINERPGVIATLYNMGNPNKKIPHSNPDVGGTIIYIDGKKYYFGQIAYLIYNYLKYYYE